MKKNALITGGSGFLGMAAAKYFKDQEYEIYGIGRKNSFNKNELLEENFKDFIESNLTNKALNNFSNVKFDLILNCASNSSISNSINNPGMDYDHSVKSIDALIEFIDIYQSDTNLIFPSSAAVYGEVENRPIPEENEKKPISPYGINKLISENKIIEFGKSKNLKVDVIRFFSLYGPNQRKQILWDAANKFSQNNDIVEFSGDGNETRDFIFISDAMKIINLVHLNKSNSFIVNGGTGKCVKIIEVLKSLQDIMGSKSKLTFNGKSRLGDPRFFNADITNLGNLGFKQKVTLSDGLKIFYNWFKEI